MRLSNASWQVLMNGTLWGDGLTNGGSMTSIVFQTMWGFIYHLMGYEKDLVQKENWDLMKKLSPVAKSNMSWWYYQWWVYRYSYFLSCGIREISGQRALLRSCLKENWGEKLAPLSLTSLWLPNTPRYAKGGNWCCPIALTSKIYSITTILTMRFCIFSIEETSGYL